MSKPLSFTGRLWEVPAPAADLRSSLLDLWAQRGLHRTDALSPETLAPPSVYRDMPLLVARLEEAARAGQRVTIVGDYDCDGVTSTRLLVRALRRRGLEPRVRLPHRVDDGYGLTTPLVQDVLQTGVDVLLTVDTGVTATEAVALARSQGVDVLIVDHHHLPPELPAAQAIVHPHRRSDDTPGQEVCAAHLALAVARALGPIDDEDLALGMIGTVADVMPLRGENRTLVHVGLQALRRLGPSPLAELRDRIAPEAGPLTAVDVAFRIVPRLNAAGRLASPALALKALEEGGEALDVLDRLNTERQAATQTAVDRLVMDPAADALPIAVSLSADYHPGIIGLIAARLTDVTGKPSLVGSMRDGLCTASLRSPEAYHLAEGLQTCASLFLRFGGHARAAGCTFALHQAQAVVEALAADVSAKTTPEQRLPLKRADLTLSVDQLTVQARAMLDAFEPCGAGNEEPLLHVPGVCLSGVRAVGREGLHLQAKVGACKLIAFRQGRLADQLQGETVDILARLRRDEWGGQVGVQLVVEDLRATLHPHG